MRRLILIVVDLGVIAFAGVLALLLRDNFVLSPTRLMSLSTYLGFSVLVAVFVLPLAGVNRGFWRYSTFGDAVRIVISAVLVVFGAVSLTFAVSRLDGIARAIPILHLLLIVAMMCSLRMLIRLRHSWRTRSATVPVGSRPLSSETLVVLGVNEIAELFLRSAQKFAGATVHIAGVIGRSDHHFKRRLHGVPVLGLPDDLKSILGRLEVHGVFVKRIVVALDASELTPRARTMLTDIEDSSGITVDYFAERIGFGGGPTTSGHEDVSPDADTAGALPSLYSVVSEGSLSRSYWQIKRLFDFTFSFLAIVVLAPFFLLLAALVAIDVGVPVHFWQDRPGAFGKRIRLYKFRSMRSAHNADLERIPDAERSSKIGRFLRRSRLDEVPQLFAILWGDMSFVGPRPLLWVDQDPEYAARLAVRPGLTGWAQVNGGRDVSAADKAALDIWYVTNASLLLDLRILLRTVPMVLFGERANTGAISQAWAAVDGLRSHCVGIPASGVRLSCTPGFVAEGAQSTV
jgi:lipopolysaccharide/colanic/teichoic acid biosynthesis glycosyltransferase